MASYTTNLNLKKPAGSENVAIGDINNNMDAIDQAYGTMNANINKKTTTPTNNSGFSSASSSVLKSGDTIFIGLDGTVGASGISAWSALSTITNNEFIPAVNTNFFAITIHNVTDNVMIPCSYALLNSSGELQIPIALSANKRYIIRAIGIK